MHNRTYTIITLRSLGYVQEFITNKVGIYNWYAYRIDPSRLSRGYIKRPMMKNITQSERRITEFLHNSISV